MSALHIERINQSNLILLIMASLLTFYQTAIKKVPVYKYSGIIFIAFIFLVIASKFKFNTDEVVKYSLIILGLCFLGFILAFFTKIQDIVVRISLYILIYAIVLTTACWIFGMAVFLATDGKHPRMIGRLLNYMDNKPDPTSPPDSSSVDKTSLLNTSDAIPSTSEKIPKKNDSSNKSTIDISINKRTSDHTPSGNSHSEINNPDNTTSITPTKRTPVTVTPYIPTSEVKVEKDLAENGYISLSSYNRSKQFAGESLSISTVNSFDLYDFNLNGLDLDRDFQITVKMKSNRTNGSTRFGMAWNFNSWGDFYLFTLHNEDRTNSSTVGYSIGRGKCSCEQNFVNIYWGQLSFDGNNYQGLSIVKRGATLMFYVNQTRVWSTSSYHLTSSKIAYWVADNSDAKFENAWYYQ